MLSQFNGPKRPAPYSTGHMLGKKKTQQQQQCMCLLSLHAHGYHMVDMRYTPTLGCLGCHSAFFLSLPIPPSLPCLQHCVHKQKISHVSQVKPSLRGNSVTI